MHPMWAAHGKRSPERWPRWPEMCSKLEPRQWCARVFGVWVSCECFAALFSRVDVYHLDHTRSRAGTGSGSGSGSRRRSARPLGLSRAAGAARDPEQIKKTTVNAWSTVGVNEHYTLRLAQPRTSHYGRTPSSELTLHQTHQYNFRRPCGWPGNAGTTRCAAAL